MATKRASKSRASSKKTSKTKAAPRKQAAKRQAPAAMQLHKVIEQLIDAKQRGDYAAGEAAAAALAAFHKSSAAAEVRQAAAVSSYLILRVQQYLQANFCRPILNRSFLLSPLLSD